MQFPWPEITLLVTGLLSLLLARLARTAHATEVLARDLARQVRSVPKPDPPPRCACPDHRNPPIEGARFCRVCGRVLLLSFEALPSSEHVYLSPRAR